MFEMDKETGKEKHCAYCEKKVEGIGFDRYALSIHYWCNDECYEKFYHNQNFERRHKYFEMQKMNGKYFYISIYILLLIFIIIMFVYLFI